VLGTPTDLNVQRARHEHARVVLERVVGRCAELGVDAMPVKGVLTGRLFYPDPGLRPIQDIDLRVRAGDVPSVEEAGRRAGWTFLGRSRAYGTLSFGVLGFLVEFETHVGPPGLCGLRVADMLGRAQRRIEPLGFPHLEPELHDHALHLCVNALKDKLVEASPGAVRDLEILVTLPGFDAQRFADRCRETGSATLAWIVASWLEEARGQRAWGEVRDRIGRPPNAVCARLFQLARKPSRPNLAWLRILARSAADRPTQVLRSLGTMALCGIERAIDHLSNGEPRLGTESGNP
jgi:putative nucleotidyltransferase-like protein